MCNVVQMAPVTKRDKESRGGYSEIIGAWVIYFNVSLYREHDSKYILTQPQFTALYYTAAKLGPFRTSRFATESVDMRLAGFYCPSSPFLRLRAARSAPDKTRGAQHAVN